MKNLCKFLPFFFVLLNVSLVKTLNCNENDFEEIPSWLFETNQENSKKEEEKNKTKNDLTKTKITIADDQKTETFRNSSNNDEIKQKKRKREPNEKSRKKHKPLIPNSMPTKVKSYLENVLLEHLSHKNLTKEEEERKAIITWHLRNNIIEETDLKNIQSTEDYKEYINNKKQG